MNTNGNIYTIVYTSVVVILVAAILAYASLALKDKQDANVKADTISQMLTAAKFFDKSELDSMGNDKVLEEYGKVVKSAIWIDAAGKEVGTLDIAKREICTTGELKAQDKYIKNNNTDKIKLPVFIFDKNGKKVTVIPCYGAGLWGPVWGYIALDEDLNTIIGAYFDHASETPGLGSKIKDDPSFRGEFEGKSLDFADVEPFDIVKGGAPEGKANAIDAITGATMTCKGLGAGLIVWFKAYKPYLTAAGNVASGKADEPFVPTENADSTAAGSTEPVAVLD